ncbi:MAG: gas vesicle protein GvpN [Chloroflexi bacterium]|nr:gas vesicle protein GvpN [Chloroflexota bacterium]
MNQLAAVLNDAPTTVLRFQPRAGFVETPYIQALSERALAYLRAGYPVHFRGPAGCGKTTLAVHVANQLGRPTMLIVGDDEFTTQDLVGREVGYSRRYVWDNFVHSVVKVEEDSNRQWASNRLTLACQEGFTLIYDEFTRSRPEANNTLLTVLEEKLLVLPHTNGASGYIKVHPGFAAILTSNPEEYIAVHKVQDALLDRMITIELGDFDRETEVEITASRTGLARADAERIVNLVRAFRETGEYEHRPSIRKSLMVAKLLHATHARAIHTDPMVRQVFLDVLDAGRAEPNTSPAKLQRIHTILKLLADYLPENAVATKEHENGKL